MLSIDDVRQVARLARLELSADELHSIARELTSILAYVDQLGELNLEGIEPLAHPLPIVNAFREDEPTESIRHDDALSNAPSKAGDFFGVPAILGD